MGIAASRLGETISFEEITAEAQRRWQSLTAGDRPWVRVGAALCGKAAGCDAVLATLDSSLQRHGVNAQVSQVGCLGLCFAEPLVDVQLPGGPRVFYGNVTPEAAAEIVSSHIAQGRPVDRLALGYLGQDGVDGIPDLNQHPMRARETRIALRNAGNIDPGDIYQYIANGGYQALHKALTTMTPEQTLEQVNVSGLRGRGGAAFATGTKWRFLAGSRAPWRATLIH
jgi:NADH-quinone oxidoreductase subunit F